MAFINPQTVASGGDSDWFSQFSGPNAKKGAAMAAGQAQSTAQGVAPQLGSKAGALGGGGGLDASGFANFYDFWDAWPTSDMAGAAQAWTAAHPNDPATAIGHSGDGVRYQGIDLDGITNVGSPNAQKVRLFPPTPAGGGGAGAGGAGGVGSLIAPWTENFQRRTPEQIAADPGFQFQQEQGENAVQRSAAAKGTLLTGGTLRRLTNFGQGLAHTYDQDFYNRDENEYLLRRDNFFQNQDRPYTKLSGLAALGRPTASA